MNESAVLKRLQSIFQDVFGDENLKISSDSSADNIPAWDSLMQILILQAVQDEFGSEFSVDEVSQIKTVGDIINAVLEKNNG
ncbi:MAG: acyl carrier protein [Oscillospiraceae bacterium]|nr:acyl carrier protein [Oscillospiraceae bacterium]